MLIKLENINRFALPVVLILTTLALAAAFFIKFALSEPEPLAAVEAVTEQTVAATTRSDAEVVPIRPAGVNQNDYRADLTTNPEARPNPASPDEHRPVKKRRNPAPLAFDWQKKPASGPAGLSPIELALLKDNPELDSYERKKKKAAPGIEFRRLSLQDEKGRIPADGLQRARRQMDRMRLAQDSKARAEGKDPKKVEMAGIERGGWAWLGPGNVGGRVRAININPSNPLDILAGSVSGGIWRTSNAGASWQPVDDFMANLAVTSIVRSPSTSTLLYAGTGEGFTNIDSLKGGGVFRSTDGGNTWGLLASTDPVAPNPAGCGVGAQPCSAFWSYVNRLAMAPDGTLLAATGGSDSSVRPGLPIAGGIARSNNGGASWTQQTAITAYDVDFDPNNSANAIASQLTNCGPSPPPPAAPLPPCIIFSTDGGANWNPSNVNPAITNGGTGPTNARTELAFAPSSSNVVYASVNQNGGDLYVSNDWGTNFTRVNTGNNLLGGATPASSVGWYANALWVNPRDPNFIIVGGVFLFQSGDGGATFALKGDNFNDSAVHVDHHVFVANPTFDNSTDKSVYFGNDGGVYRVDDIQNFSRTDGWTELNNNLGVTQFYGGAATPTGVIFGGTQDNGTLRVTPTSNATPPYNTETWSEFFGNDGGYVAADPTDGNYLYGEMQNMGIVRSTDGGVTASFIYCSTPPSATTGGACPGPGAINDAFTSSNFIAPFILDPSDPNTMLAGGVNLWRSNDVKTGTNPTWTIAKNPNPTIPPPGGTAQPNPISAIAVSAVNSNFIVVGHNDGQIFLTVNGTNGSPTWNSITPPIIPGAAVNFNRFVSRLAIDATKNPNWIYATLGGFSDGNVIRSEDLGATWIDVSGAGGTSLPQVPVRSIILNPAVPNNLYVGTEVGIFASEDAGATWQLPHGGPANVSVDELFWMNGDIVAATHGRGMYKTSTPVVAASSCIFNVDSDLGCPNTACAPGQIACSGSNCTCCTAGAWNCPCSWNTQKVPTETDDPYVACPMTGGGGARSITIGPGGGLTFNGSGGLRAFGGDIVNFGFVRVDNPFGSSQIAADRHISNFGTIQMPGSIIAGGVLSNQGLIAVSGDVNVKGLTTRADSTLTLNRLFVEGDIQHNGSIADNNIFPFQINYEFRSPAGQTSTFSGSGTWTGPRGGIVPGSSFVLGSNVTIALGDFRNSGTLNLAGHQLTFTGSSFTNFPQQEPDGQGIIGAGVVAMAPSGGTATFVNASRDFGPPIAFTPQLRIASGDVITSGNVSEVVVDAGATMRSGIMSIGGNLTVNGSIEPLDAGTSYIDFNGTTLTNNGTIGNLFMLNFNTTGVARTQNIVGPGIWSPRNVRLGLYSPSTTTLSMDNDIRFNTNDFIIATGSTLALSTRTITLAGPVRLSNDGSITGNVGTVRFEASGAGGQVAASNGALFQSPIEIASGQVGVRQGSSVLTFERDFRVNAGATFTMTGPAVVTTRNVLNNGTINILAGTPFAVFEPRGQIFTNNGLITGPGLIFRFGPGVGGPFTHQINGTGTWSTMEQILVNVGSTLELTSDVTYSGNSIHLLGNLNALTNTLSLPCTTSWGGPGETFGNIRRTNLGACSGAVAFGNPFTTLQFTGGAAPTEATMGIRPAAPTDFAGAIQRSYDISAFGGGAWTANVRLHYLDSELNGNTEAALTMHRSDGTAWAGLGATSRNSTENWVELTGVTQFSLWTLSSLLSPPPANTPPTLGNIQITHSISEGGTATLTGTISDPNAADTFSLVVTWGDGTQDTYNYPANTTSFSQTHVYTDNPSGAAAFDVGLSLSDSQSGTATGSTSVVVANVAPTITALSGTPSTLQTGATLTVNGSFSDPGTGDAHGVVIDWGDGSTPTEIELVPGILSFSATHTFATTGDYTVTATVADDDAGIDSETTNVTVTEAPPTPPAAPSNLTAAPVSRNQIDLTWVDNPVNEDGFVVELCGKGKNCASSTEIGRGGAGATSFSHTGLKAGTTYKYRVRAFNAGGSSGYSNIATAKTPRK